MLFILPVREDLPAALAHHDGGPGVLAHGQHSARRDPRVLQQIQGHETIVAAGFRIIEDGPQLAQMARPQQVGDVAHALAGDQGQHLRVHLEEVPAQGLAPGDPVRGQQAVLGGVRAQGKQVGVRELGHRGLVLLVDAVSFHRRSASAWRSAGRHRWPAPPGQAQLARRAGLHGCLLPG
jgi:hypothetical protein